MKSIPLKKAITILDNCTAVYLDDTSLVFPAINWNENYFLTLNSDNGGEENFINKDNGVVEIDSYGRLILTNTRGEKAYVMPLVCRPVK